MDADRRPHVRLPRGQRGGGARGGYVGSDRHHAPDASRARSRQHGVEIAGELREMQVRVRVEEIGVDHTAPSTAAAFFTSRAFTHRIAEYRPPPASASIAVTLTFAVASLLSTSAQAPMRSSPSIRNARLGPVSFHLCCLARAFRAAPSVGTRSSWAPRPLGKPEYATRFTPARRSSPSTRAPSPGLSGTIT